MLALFKSSWFKDIHKRFFKQVLSLSVESSKHPLIYRDSVPSQQLAGSSVLGHAFSIENGSKINLKGPIIIGAVAWSILHFPIQFLPE